MRVWELFNKNKKWNENQHKQKTYWSTYPYIGADINPENATNAK